MVVLVVGGGVAALAFPRVRELAFGRSQQNPDLVFETVKKGPFNVTVTERGVVGSLKNSTLTNSVEGTTTIISIVPEGTDVHGPVRSKVAGTVREIIPSGESQIVVVESDATILSTPWFLVPLEGQLIEHRAVMHEYTKVIVDVGERVEAGDYLVGDVLCVLDSFMLEEQEKTQQIAVTQAEADLEKGRKNVEIQINQNLSDIAAAQLKLDLALLDLKKFERGERIQQLNEHKGEVLIAQEELTQAEETYRFYKRLAKKDYKTQVDVETARVAVVKARNKLAVAQEKLNVLQNYTFERTHKELTEMAEEARRELKRVQLSGLAALAQFQAELRARQLTYSVELEKLHRLQRQIKACTLVAPQDGKVVYATQRSRRREPEVIEEGATVRERQRIINLPDFSRMKVEAKIHESKISNVREGMQARIRIDAIPDRVFKGKVEDVPDVPVKGDWPNTDLMLYETQVRIHDDVTGLKPGMNATVEIISQERDDVIQVPVQALVAVGDGFIAYVRDDESPTGATLRENIKIGVSGSKTVEIKSGLEPGEEVVMNPKTHFGSEISRLRAKVKKSRAKAAAEAARNRRDTGNSGKAKRKSTKARKTRSRSGNAMQAFQKMDKNSNGTVEKGEARGPLQKNFDKVDANGDGKVDAGEFQIAIQARSGGGG